MAENKNISAALALEDGYYKVSGTWYTMLLVKKESNMVKGTVIGDIPVDLSFGDFGEADHKIYEATGQNTYNVELAISVNGEDHRHLGMVLANGCKMITKSSMGLHDYEKISEEEAIGLLEDGDPIDALPTLYKFSPKIKVGLYGSADPRPG